MASTPDRLALRLGALFGLFGVILGALAAHKGDRSSTTISSNRGGWRPGTRRCFTNGSTLWRCWRSARRDGTAGIVICWLIGVVLFSGSLYILSLDSAQKWAGPLTPLGGLMLMIGWAWLWISLLKKPAA